MHPGKQIVFPGVCMNSALWHGRIVVLGFCHAPGKAEVLDKHGKGQEFQSCHAPKQSQGTKQASQTIKNSILPCSKQRKGTR